MEVFNLGQIMNPRFTALVAFILVSIVGSCEAETLCKTSEKVIFSCLVQNGKKIVSVCGSNKLTKDKGYLQYRFGTLTKPELVYPSTTKATQDKFYWRYMHGPEGSGGDLSFKNHEYLYTVERSDAYEETNDIPGTLGSVTISKIGGGASTQHRLKCDGVPEGNFYEIDGIVKDEEEIVTP